jgi:hypothetical protein
MFKRDKLEYERSSRLYTIMTIDTQAFNRIFYEEAFLLTNNSELIIFNMSFYLTRI